jgi:hypothetical protein
MTADELRAWIKRRGLTHAAAARLLAMSIKGLRKNLYGERRISPRTERIVQLDVELESGAYRPPSTKP